MPFSANAVLAPAAETPSADGSSWSCPFWWCRSPIGLGQARIGPSTTPQKQNLEAVVRRRCITC